MTKVLSIISAGLNIWGKYEKELAKVIADQQELANAQKLLDLPVSVYLDLINVQKDMLGLRQIYDVFEAQKVNVKFNFYIDEFLFLLHTGQIVYRNVFIYLFLGYRMQNPNGLRPCGWI